MHIYPHRILLVLLSVSVTACTTSPPPGPSVAVMPGPEKTFELFQQDDAVCRQFALQQIGLTSPAQAQQNSTLTWGTIGTVAGTAVGAAIGSVSHNTAAGAVIGAGTGMAVGAVAGASQGESASDQVQRAYDVAYQQCMFAKGNSIASAATAKPLNPKVYSVPPDYIWIDDAWKPRPRPHHRRRP